MKRQLGLPAGLIESHPIGGPFKSNSRSRYVELVLVVDNKSYENQDKDLKRVFRRCKDIANIVNAVSVYTSPGLITQKVHSHRRQCHESMTHSSFFHKRCLMSFYITAVRAAQHLCSSCWHCCLVRKGRNSNLGQRRWNVDQFFTLPTS